VPSLVVFLAKAKIVDKYDLSSLRAIKCGAAPLSEEIEILVRKRLRLDSFSQGFGMTETTHALTGTPVTVNKTGSVGVLLPDVQCKVNNHFLTSNTRQDRTVLTASTVVPPYPLIRYPWFTVARTKLETEKNKQFLSRKIYAKRERTVALLNNQPKHVHYLTYIPLSPYPC
jgi:acyl-coenzyme A synthetase/AMP-(fatty) acid ligase